NRVLPGANKNLAAFNFHRNPRPDLGQLGLRVPLLRLLELISCGVKDLAKISLAIGQGHGYYRGAQISRRTKGVACQDSQTSAVCRNVWFESNFHRKIGYPGRTSFLHLPSFAADLNVERFPEALSRNSVL